MLCVEKSEKVQTDSDLRPLAIIPVWIIVLEKLGNQIVKKLFKDKLSIFQFGANESRFVDLHSCYLT